VISFLQPETIKAKRNAIDINGKRIVFFMVFFFKNNLISR